MKQPAKRYEYNIKIPAVTIHCFLSTHFQLCYRQNIKVLICKYNTVITDHMLRGILNNVMTLITQHIHFHVPLQKNDVHTNLFQLGVVMLCGHPQWNYLPWGQDYSSSSRISTFSFIFHFVVKGFLKPILVITSQRYKT